MTFHETSKLRAALEGAFAEAIALIGIAAFKQTSFFGSNDPAFKSSKSTDKLKQAA